MGKEKKSLTKAKIEAYNMSIKFKYIPYFVLDKKGGKACCVGIPWVKDRMIIEENYFTICKYINGIEYTNE